MPATGDFLPIYKIENDYFNLSESTSVRVIIFNALKCCVQVNGIFFELKKRNAENKSRRFRFTHIVARRALA